MSFPSKKPVAAATPARAAAGVPAKGGQSFTASPKGTKPTHVLKAKVGKEGKFERITGLFESISKDGETYLKGTDKNNDVSYVIVLNNYEEKFGSAGKQE